MAKLNNPLSAAGFIDSQGTSYATKVGYQTTLPCDSDKWAAEITECTADGASKDESGKPTCQYGASMEKIEEKNGTCTYECKCNKPPPKGSGGTILETLAF